MKKIIFLIIYSLLVTNTNAQSFIGAWERNHTSENGEELKSVVIFSDGYQAISTYESKSGKFINSNGGTWELMGDTMTEKVEFDTNNPDRVGSEVTFKVKITETTMSIVGTDMEFQRIDDGLPGYLKGAWLMAGRVRDGKKQLRNTSGPRKTMKLLSGKRFQWIAYNTESKKFMGTGGGTYTTKNGVYSENIEFFSRDNSKSGIELEFEYEIIDNEWNHKGFSSKGDPLHEIWKPRL
ncbi:MAG: membrane or secreted protein [Flavobacteriaceae bacterium]|nr:membrane or secreted protein [Flavobacteriaceae bacterium]